MIEAIGVVAAEGAAFLGHFGRQLDAIRAQRRMFCRPCLDWTERRPHLGGALGAAMFERCMGLGWIERRADTRAVRITLAGSAGLAETFGVPG
jgi:hypothetical protein